MDTDQKLSQIISILSTTSANSNEKLLESIRDTVKSLQMERAMPSESTGGSTELKSTVRELRGKIVDLKSRVKELETALLYDTKNPTEEELKSEVTFHP